jgi:TolB-like protein
MDRERWRRIEDLYHAARSLPGDQRGPFLAQQCAGDASVRSEVESLLAQPDQTWGPAADAGAVGRQNAVIAGQRIGGYHVEAMIGAGGMGEVYRAHDPKLGRDVAIKILPRDWSADPDRVARLDREARVLASLNHPNIATIHGIEEDAGIRALILELVEGETLAERVSRGAVPVRDALRLACQIADALDAAHEKGIVHRDLKPANIKITPAGVVKVLDFGLAKLAGGETAALSNSPTLTVGGTREGMIAGTAAYMSPEQARGLAVDKRTDVWAFGCVLYELLTGRRLFAAETLSDTLAAVLHRQPDWTSLPKGTPAATRELLQRCLERDPARRLRDIREVRHALEQGEITGHRRPGAVARLRWLWVAAVLLVGLAATAIFSMSRPYVSGVAPLRSLAVLPLRSLDAGVDDTIALGITSDVITKVSRIQRLTVRPMSAVRKYAGQEISALDAARALEVDAILDGTLQRDGPRVRVNVNLLRRSDGGSIWSDTFDVAAAGVFEIQDRLSKSIASQLRISLTEQESASLSKRYTSSAAAYEAYLRGMLVLDERTTVSGDRRLVRAIEAFEQAEALDPSFALAYAQAGFSYAWMALFNDPANPQWVQMARNATARAIALDPLLAQPHLTRFQLAWSRYESFDMPQAIRELVEAQRLDPTAGLVDRGIFAAHCGFAEYALADLTRAVEIDPTSVTARILAVESQVLLGRYDEALAMARRFDIWSSETRIVLAFLRLGDLPETQRALARDLTERPADAAALSARALWSVLAKQGAPDADMERAIELSTGNRAFHHVAYNVATIYAEQGKPRDVVDWLQRVVDTGMPNYPLFETDPPLRRLQTDPTFSAFMADLKPKWQSLQAEFETAR